MKTKIKFELLSYEATDKINKIIIKDLENNKEYNEKYGIKKVDSNFDKEKAKKLIEQFEYWHHLVITIGQSHQAQHKTARVIGGYWYWKGYKLAELSKILNNNN